MNSYFITTLGCQANMADSNKISATLNKSGYQAAKNENELMEAKNALLVFNTCSVKQKAEDRIFGLNKKLRELKDAASKSKVKLKIVLTGCMMHYKEKELKRRLPYFDYFIDIKKIETLPKLLKLKKQTKTDPRLKGLRKADLPDSSSEASALIPISHGCDNFCTYCIVPLARGREISRTVLDIINDVEKAVSAGTREIWLLGQTVNSYKNGDTNFANLLRLVNAVSGDFWIRFASPHPKDFSDDLIGAMAECEKFARYINLPVQSGNNAVLKRMGRPYTVSHYKKLVKKIRKVMPNISLSTDAIVGFPGETRKQFEDTLKLFKEIKFDMAFISEYSPRPKTAAAKYFEDDVPHKEKEKRKDELNEILKKTALENNKRLVGKVMKVLNNRTEGNKLIKIDGNYTKNKFASAKITKANTWSLKGKLL